MTRTAHSETADDEVILTRSEIVRREQEVEKLRENIATLEVELQVQLQWLHDFRRLFPNSTPPTAHAEQALGHRRPAPRAVKPAVAKQRFAPPGTIMGSWDAALHEALGGFEKGATYAELRAALEKTNMAENLQHSPKSYQKALSRLAGYKRIVREHGRVFLPEAHERFMESLGDGTSSSVVPRPYVRSPMGEAILKIVHANPGIVSKGIIRHLHEQEEFHAVLTPHETGAFNIIARLVRREQIIRRDDGQCFPGGNFPYQELGLTPYRDEALNGQAVSASVTRRDANPSLFSTPPSEAPK